jgi:hypothetical protein
VPQKHASVIYVHGVGNPKRYVSLSTFLDYFDLFGQRQTKELIGKPRNFSSKSEILGENIQRFVEFKKINVFGGRPVTTKTIRVYESYWAPDAVSRFGMLYVLGWLLTRAWLPLKIGVASWRSFPALRLNALHRLGDTELKFKQLQKLEQHYRDFENWENRGRYRRGSFYQFLEYVSAKSSDIIRKEMVDAACLWKWHFNLSVAKIAAIAILFVTLLIVPLFFISKYIYDNGYNVSLLINIIEKNKIVDLEVLIYTMLGLYFLRRVTDYVYDVIAWTMESERDRRFSNRRRMVLSTQNLIRSIVNNEQCSECYIVAHSLGTSISMEALLNEGEFTLAKDGSTTDPETLPAMAKIKAIFTVGSPIDLIFSFFQADRTFSHRYHRLHEDQRQSISLPPFRFGGVVGKTKIINIWSRFDPISSKIFSLRKSVSERSDAIINIEALPSGFPSPIASHTSYFSDPGVMNKIYRAIMLGEIPDKTDNLASNSLKRFGLWAAFVVASSWIFAAFFYMRYGAILIPIAFCAVVTVTISRWRSKIVSTYCSATGDFLDRARLDKRPSHT